MQLHFWFSKGLLSDLDDEEMLDVLWCIALDIEASILLSQESAISRSKFGEGCKFLPVVVHQPASPIIWPAVQSLRRGLSTNPEVAMWCVCGCSCVVYVSVTKGA